MNDFAELADMAQFIMPTLAAVDNMDNDEMMTALQLLCTFHTLDVEGINFLSREQVAEALRLLGMNPRANVLDKYFVNSQAKEKGGNKKELVNLPTFISTTFGELGKCAHDFNLLFNHMGTGKSINLKDLKQILVGVKAPTSLTLQEFDEFLLGLGFTTHERSTLEGSIKCDQLCQLLLLPQQKLLE